MTSLEIKTINTNAKCVLEVNQKKKEGMIRNEYL